MPLGNSTPKSKHTAIHAHIGDSIARLLTAVELSAGNESSQREHRRCRRAMRTANPNELTMLRFAHARATNYAVNSHRGEFSIPRYNPRVSNESECRRRSYGKCCRVCVERDGESKHARREHEYTCCYSLYVPASVDGGERLAVGRQRPPGARGTRHVSGDGSRKVHRFCIVFVRPSAINHVRAGKHVSRTASSTFCVHPNKNRTHEKHCRGVTRGHFVCTGAACVVAVGVVAY